MAIVVMICVRVLQFFFFAFFRLSEFFIFCLSSSQWNIIVCVKRIEDTATHHHTQLSGSEYMSLFQDVSDHISFDSPSSNDAASK
jgi:hypothetical protein